MEPMTCLPNSLRARSRVTSSHAHFRIAASVASLPMRSRWRRTTWSPENCGQEAKQPRSVDGGNERWGSGGRWHDVAGRRGNCLARSWVVLRQHCRQSAMW